MPVRLLLVAVLLALPATASAAGPVRLAEAPHLSLERVVGGNVYFTQSAAVNDPDYTLMRRDAAGNVQSIAQRSHIAAEAAADVGVVVETGAPLVPQDSGGFDIYLIRPDGTPVLLTAGKPWGEWVGNSFGSLTPDRRGIVFASSPDLTDDVCAGSINGANSNACDLYGWRDGVLTNLDRGAEVGGYVASGGYATDDFSQVFAVGVDERNSTFTVPIAAFFQPPGGGPALRDRMVVGVSTDHRTALLDGIEDEHGLLRWTGVADPTPVGTSAPNANTRFLGGSPDLSRVFYAARDAVTGDYDVYLNAGGTDTKLTPDPVSGAHADSPPVEDGVARVAPDGSAVAFRTLEALTTDDADGFADVYIWSSDGLKLASTGTKSGVRDIVGFTGSHVAFYTDEPVTCADTDTSSDVYIASGDTLGLATPGTESDLSGVEQAPDGDVVYVDQRDGVELLMKSGAVTGCAAAGDETVAPVAGNVRVRLRGRAPRKCGRRSCGRRARLTVRTPAAARIVVRIRRGKRWTRLVKRSVGAGVTHVRLPYLPRAFKRGRRYPLKVTVRPAGGPRTVKTLKVRVR